MHSFSRAELSSLHEGERCTQKKNAPFCAMNRRRLPADRPTLFPSFLPSFLPPSLSSLLARGLPSLPFLPPFPPFPPSPLPSHPCSVALSLCAALNPSFIPFVLNYATLGFARRDRSARGWGGRFEWVICLTFSLLLFFPFEQPTTLVTSFLYLYPPPSPPPPVRTIITILLLYYYYIITILLLYYYYIVILSYAFCFLYRRPVRRISRARCPRRRLLPYTAFSTAHHSGYIATWG